MRIKKVKNNLDIEEQVKYVEFMVNFTFKGVFL